MDASKIDSSDELVRERGQQYGAAWYITGQVIAEFVHFLRKVFSSNYAYNWIIILNKLMRLANDMDHVDSWRDIESYSRLVVVHMETGRTDGSRGS